tara:strand:- start:6 stop:431 length:426 start_codon:yes stop_codon:yes gene_type:complete
MATMKTFDDYNAPFKSIRFWERPNQTKHQCYLDILYLYIQMKTIGQICTGYRKKYNDVDTNPHWWLEVGDYAYQITMCEFDDLTLHWIMQTFKKEEFYDHYKIVVERKLTDREAGEMVIRAHKRGLIECFESITVSKPLPP